MEKVDYYIQYHNADKQLCYPSSEANYDTPVETLKLDNTEVEDSWIYTRKKQVKKAGGSSCFLIVGKTEKIKKYYLWSFFKINSCSVGKDGFYDVSGKGFCFEQPILLNTLEYFEDFKKFCGNFSIGFQQINKHSFLKTLYSFKESEMHKNRADSSSDSQEDKEIDTTPILNTFEEGAVSQITQTRYERDPHARKDCLKHYGFSCFVCGFNFEEKYGELGENFIHVHHLNPVAAIEKSGEPNTNPINDLRPVCPNCHSMLHKKNPPLTIEELQGVLKQ